MAKPRVVLNRRNFGEQVMSSDALAKQLRPAAESVAAQVPGSTMRWIVTKAGAGGSRGRWRIEAENTFERQTRADLVAAIRSVIGRATTR